MAPLPPGEHALNLALAIVASSTSPLLLLDGGLTVVAASASFCRAFGVDPATIVGRPVFELDGGAWDMPRLRSLLDAAVSGAAEVDAYELDLSRPHQPTRRLVLNAHVLDYAGAPDSGPDAGNLRLLLAVADITDARAAERQKDDLIREKVVLLQEVQHRVANSLQIIASVLMQSARKVQSEETRGHLQSAHHRVMSIASVQRQLAASHAGDVALRPYFAQLCQSLAASMIDDDARSIVVEVDDSAVKANTSVSLGLVVTELVINALKHAFPADRPGRITVDYRSRNGGWALSVRDDGVGMPAGGVDQATPGLGTSIVNALAKQLGATITVTATNPGTRVTLVRNPVVGVASNDTPEPAEAAV